MFKLKIIFSLVIIIFLFSCNEDEKQETLLSQINNDSIEYARQTIVDMAKIKQKETDRAKWIEFNTQPLNQLLINFSATHPDDEEKRNFSKHDGEIMTFQFLDSIVVVFGKRVYEGCGIIGNISVMKDTVKLLYQDVCTPLDMACKCGGMIKFRYVIKRTNEIAGKVFKAEQGYLLKH